MRSTSSARRRPRPLRSLRSPPRGERSRQNFATGRDPGYVAAMSRIVQLVAASVVAGLAALAAAGSGGRAAADEPRDATRGGVNGSASPVQPPADGKISPLLINVEVGQTAERDVGIAIGLLCDDVSIMHAELRSETPQSNVLRVTGVQPGDTRCRAGTVPGRPMFVFEIHVTARRAAPP
jgi:hypothetical protein